MYPNLGNYVYFQGASSLGFSQKVVKLLILLEREYPSFSFDCEYTDYGMGRELIIRKNDKECFSIAMPNGKIVTNQFLAEVDKAIIEWKEKE